MWIPPAHPPVQSLYGEIRVFRSKQKREKCPEALFSIWIQSLNLEALNCAPALTCVSGWFVPAQSFLLYFTSISSGRVYSVQYLCSVQSSKHVHASRFFKLGFWNTTRCLCLLSMLLSWLHYSIHSVAAENVTAVIWRGAFLVKIVALPAYAFALGVLVGVVMLSLGMLWRWRKSLFILCDRMTDHALHSRGVNMYVVLKSSWMFKLFLSHFPDISRQLIGQLLLHLKSFLNLQWKRI